jgi:hypothetical protein
VVGKSVLLRHNAKSLGEWFLMLQRIIVPSSSRVYRAEEKTSWASIPWKMKVLQSFRTSVTTHPNAAPDPRTTDKQTNQPEHC